MREVRTCDFCGETAAGTFEVVPPERDPAGDGRRLVLCPACRETLGDVLEPLLGGASDTGGDATAAEDIGTTTVVAEPESSPGDATTANDGRRDPEAATDGSRVDAQGGDSLEEALGGSPTSARSGAPRGYRKVMRFLENREFPVEREEAETLAAEAYGMDRESVAAAIDHAVKHNRLREASGKLLQ
jgi:hypothetical protein